MEAVSTPALTQLPHINAAVGLDIGWAQMERHVMVSNLLFMNSS